MFKRLLLAFIFSLIGTSAWAQNPQCPTRPPGDSSNACASTAFTQQAVQNPIGPVILPIGSTATTQTPFDNSTLVATDSFVNGSLECPAIEFYGGGTGKTAAQNATAWSAFATAVVSVGNACVSFKSGHYSFSASASFALSSGQKITIHGAGMHNTYLDFQGAIGGIAITASGAQPAQAYIAGNAVDIRDLTATTDQVGTQIGISVNLQSTVSQPMKQTNIQNVSVAGAAAADYWNQGIYIQDVQNVHMSAIQTWGCYQCNATTTDTHITYNASNSSSNAGQFQLTDWYANWGGTGLSVTGYPQGITVTNANIVGLNIGANVNFTSAEEVCNFNNVQANTLGPSLKIKNCNQGVIKGGTFYVGSFGTEASAQPIIDLISSAYMIVSANDFQGFTNNTFTPNGLIVDTGSTQTVVVGNTFNTVGNGISVISGVTFTQVGVNNYANLVGGADIADSGTNTSIFDTYVWASFTPTVTCGSGSLGSGNTYTGRYQRMGKLMFVNVDITIGASGIGTCGAYFLASALPQTSFASAQPLAGKEVTNGSMLVGQINASTSAMTIVGVGGSFVGANSDHLIVQGFYETN